MRTFAALGVIASALSFQSANAADIQSGLQVGDYPGAYKVEDITGPAAGEKLCYRCRYGTRPVVNIFTRSMNADVAKLIKDLDAVVGKNKDAGMGAFVVLLTDKPEAEAKNLKQAAGKLGIKHTPLTVFENANGPSKYKIAKGADITVMMWVESDVKVNHAMKVADLNATSIAKIISDTKEILN